MAELPAPIPAATLILMRPALAGPPEIAMIERAANMVFAAGALAFPGGRIDPADHAAAAGSAFEDAPARIAAIRETIEETGLAPGLCPSPSAGVATQLRSAMAAGDPLADVLHRHDLSLDLAALTPFARWCPNFRETRRFDALFFIAAAPPETAHAAADETEATRIIWATAAAILEDIAYDRAQAIFPTRRNLERLATFASLEEALASTRRYPVRTITPWVEQREGEKWLCIPDDAGYPITAEPLATARRS